jgi:hypothetical protein
VGHSEAFAAHLTANCRSDVVEVLLAPDPSRHYAVTVKYARTHGRHGSGRPSAESGGPWVSSSMLDLMEANVQLGTLFLAYATKLLPILNDAVKDVQARRPMSTTLTH